jgi:hypothetical protein
MKGWKETEKFQMDHKTIKTALQISTASAFLQGKICIISSRGPCTETWRSQAEFPSVVEHLHSKQNKRQVKPKPLVVATRYLAI